MGIVWSRFDIARDHKARRPATAALSSRRMLAHLAAFLVRLAVSAAVLMLSVGWVTPRNPDNTFARAAVVSLFLSFAWYVTLARFFWFLVVPWLLYVAIWLVTVMAAYDMGFLRALLLAVALAFLSFLVSLFFGLRPL
jgi:putative membrane protein